LTREWDMPVMRRYGGGLNVRGGCGMLAGRPRDARAADHP
jgi:hypothetical protein